MPVPAMQRLTRFAIKQPIERPGTAKCVNSAHTQIASDILI